MKKVLFLLGVSIAFVCLSRGYFLTPEAKAETSCLIRFNVFDNKIHDPALAETIMMKDGLVSKGALIEAIKMGKLPFDSISGDSKIIGSVFKELEIQLCGKVGDCNVEALKMEIVCESSSLTGNTVNDAQLAYSARIAAMSPCQKDVFENIQLKNSQYLQEVKTANTKYYQQLAPLTADLLKLYRHATDNKDRETLLNNYIAANKGLRSKLYASQTGVFNKFISDRASLQKQFNDCK